MKNKKLFSWYCSQAVPVRDDHIPHQTSKMFCFPTTADKYLIDSKLVGVLGLLPRCKVKQQLCVSSFNGNVPCKGINAYGFATTIKQQTFLQTLIPLSIMVTLTSDISCAANHTVRYVTGRAFGIQF